MSAVVASDLESTEDVVCSLVTSATYALKGERRDAIASGNFKCWKLLGREHSISANGKRARRRGLAFSCSRKGWRRQSGWRHLRGKRLTRSWGKSTSLLLFTISRDIAISDTRFSSAANFFLPPNTLPRYNGNFRFARHLRAKADLRETRAKPWISLRASRLVI